MRWVVWFLVYFWDNVGRLMSCIGFRFSLGFFNYFLYFGSNNGWNLFVVFWMLNFRNVVRLLVGCISGVWFIIGIVVGIF